MFNKKLIAGLTALIFSFGASLTVAQGAHFRATAIGRPEGPAFGTLNLESMVLAQNDQTAPDENEKSQSEPETDESEAAAEDEQKPSEAESKPLKPFVPSEKIPGEQAVDFPVDI
jgi:hypothetical protein